MPAVLTFPAVWVLTLSLLWLGIVLRYPTLRRSPRQRAGALIFFCITMAATLTVPSVRYAVDAATGVADLSILSGHLFTLLGTAFSLEIVAVATGARRAVRAGQVVFGVAMSVLVVLFWALIPRQLDHPDFGLWQVHHPAVITYQMTFQTCLAVALIVNLVIMRPLWLAAPRGRLRTSLLLLWLGAGIGLAYVASRMWYILAHGFSLVQQITRPTYGLATLLLLYAALLCAGAGAMVRAAHSARQYLRRYLRYRELGALWAELTQAVPGTVLKPPDQLMSLELRLYRRTVEIRDAQLELAGHVTPEMRATAAKALGYHTESELDACVLRMALDGERHTRPEHDSTVHWTPDLSLDGEVAALLELHHLMRAPATLAAARKGATCQGT